MRQNRNTKSQKPTALQDLQQQVKVLTEALQRERADALNVRRRAEEERTQLGTTIKAMVIEELLPALDNLERALKHIPDNISDISRVAPWKQGVEGVAKQFDKALEDLGVTRIKTVGEHFDPKYHEAVHMEDSKGSVEVVCEELQPGYKIGDEVIRHATVKVKMQSSPTKSSEVSTKGEAGSVGEEKK